MYITTTFNNTYITSMYTNTFSWYNVALKLTFIFFSHIQKPSLKIQRPYIQSVDQSLYKII